MKISCDIIRDILPLYAEDMVSDATRELVDDHLCGCDGCAKELGELKKKEALPLDADTEPIKRIGKSIQKQKLWTVACVVLTIASLIWSGVLFLTTPIYLSSDQAIEGVELREDGSLAVDYAWGAMERRGTQRKFPWKLTTAMSTRYEWMKAKRWNKELMAMPPEQREAEMRDAFHGAELTQSLRDQYEQVDPMWCFRNENGETYVSYTQELTDDDKKMLQWEVYERSDHSYDLWYWGTDGYTLLWNGGDGVFPMEFADGTIYDTGTVYYGSFVICLILSVLGAVAAFFMRRSHWQEYPVRILILNISAAVYLLLVTGGNFADPVGVRSDAWLRWFFPTLFLFAFTLGAWTYLHTLKKRDKAI